MGACILDFLPCDIRDSGWWGCEDVGLVLGKESINELVYVLDVAIVDWLPSFLNDGVNLQGVGGVSPWWLSRSGGSLDGLQRLGELLLDALVDVALGLLAPQLRGCGLSGSLG